MAKVHPGRFTAEIEGDFVVFLIGMRINKFWKLHKWLPVALAMPPMQRQQQRDASIGMLGQQAWFGRTTILVQYWRSAEDLMTFAHNADLAHRGAWKAFNRAVGTNGDVGIWHETFVVRAGDYETIYGNMPLFGLARAGAHVPFAKRGEGAAQRLAHHRPARP
jgi:hypothetical protein